MIDVNVAIASLTTVGSAVMIIFYGGRQVGKVEAAVARLGGIEAKVEKIPLLSTKIEILENMYTNTHSDIRSLKTKVEILSEKSAEMRGKLASQHGE